MRRLRVLLNPHDGTSVWRARVVEVDEDNTPIEVVAFFRRVEDAELFADAPWMERRLDEDSHRQYL